MESIGGIRVLRLSSEDETNRLSRSCVQTLTQAFVELSKAPGPLVIAGNHRFFSAGAEILEVSALTGPEAREFSQRGQALMAAVESFPAPVYAAISGYCMGGGLDLALACHLRIASPNAVFGHRGPALGLITGWGGTQRLPRLVGKSIATQLFVAAESVSANRALEIGLVQELSGEPVEEAVRLLTNRDGIGGCR